LPLRRVSEAIPTHRAHIVRNFTDKDGVERRSAAVAEPRGANGEAVTGSGGRLHFGMVAGIKSERWLTSNWNPIATRR
jgi:hypothetical protein